MKKFVTLFILSSIFSAPTFALTTFTPFISIEQAELYCPNVAALTFTQTNPQIHNGAGTISGNYNNVSFANLTSGSNQMLHPKEVATNGLIAGAQFRDANGMFGYISGDMITCLYQYTGFTGVDVALVMRGKSN